MTNCCTGALDAPETVWEGGCSMAVGAGPDLSLRLFPGLPVPALPSSPLSALGPEASLLIMSLPY